MDDEDLVEAIGRALSVKCDIAPKVEGKPSTQKVQKTKKAIGLSSKVKSVIYIAYLKTTGVIPKCVSVEVNQYTIKINKNKRT